MAFDPTPGSPTANSYLSLERLAELITEDPYSVVVADETRQKSILISATRNLDTILCPSGIVRNSDQSLKFPRSNLINSDGRIYDQDLIPLPIELAVFKLYNLLATSNIFARSDVAVQNLISLKADTVELKFSEGAGFNLIPEEVRLLIPSEWLCVIKSKSLIFMTY